MAAATTQAQLALAGKASLVVGGTNGIGRGLAEWLAGQGASVTVAGRSEQRGAEVVEACAARYRAAVGAAGPTSATTETPMFAFARVDASLIRDVRRFCTEYAATHDRLDYLVLTAGIASMAGYSPTVEGIDEKLAVHCYGRVATVLGLLPLLERSTDGRVLTVLSAGVHSAYAGYRTDPSLKQSFSIANAANAAGFYNDIAMDALAAEHPKVTFAHAAPGFVATAWGSGFHPVLKGLIRGLQYTLAKSPERCASLIGVALTAPEYRGGFRLLDQNGRPARVTAEHAAARDVVWNHIRSTLDGIDGSSAPASSTA